MILTSNVKSGKFFERRVSFTVKGIVLLPAVINVSFFKSHETFCLKTLSLVFVFLNGTRCANYFSSAYVMPKKERKIK